jgi:Asp-tRNA(Asn)/Glu-tRNA(Gln) amidotransferase A subunit family amidase
MNLQEAHARIRALPDYNVFISLSQDLRCAGPAVGIKDLIDVKGMVTTGGGILGSRQPATEDAPVIENIRRAGGCIVGKTNLHEWAFGVTNENPHYGWVRNPRDPSRVAGGSSGGSAAAVAAGMCDWAVGTDTGGSIRIPASLCGVVGIKPSSGLISTHGMVPLARTLDVVGPLAPDVRTAARAVVMMGGLTRLAPPSDGDHRELKLGVPAGWVEGLDSETLAVWDRVREGIPDVEFPSRRRLEQPFQMILFAEASAFHLQWMESRPNDYGPDVLQLLRMGLKVRGADYVRALDERVQLQREADQAMGALDALLLPATSCVAPPLGTPHVREKLLRFTRPFNLTDQPVVVLPAVSGGLPVGIQVIGRRGQDARLFAVAQRLERAWGGRLRDCQLA